jgi:sulfur carrier protein ThiS adenylyltransferase
MNETKRMKIQEKLHTKTVGIAGAGGLGSNAAISLVRAGVGTIIIVDYDVVERSNLNRQYYFSDQLGMKKVFALKENIQRIYPTTRVEAIELTLEKGNMYKPFIEADVIIEALDKAETKTDFIEDVLEHLPETPLVAASGVAGYGHSDRITTQHLDNLHICYDEKAESSENDVLLAPKVCLMANWQANIVLELLLGEME